MVVRRSPREARLLKDRELARRQTLLRIGRIVRPSMDPPQERTRHLLISFPFPILDSVSFSSLLSPPSAYII